MLRPGDTVGNGQLSSGKFPDTHPVGAIDNHNLGVFTVTKVAMENTYAVTPAHLVSRTPQTAYPGWQRCRGPSAPLTCLAWPAAWQSLCTGHFDASLKPSALTFTGPGPPERKIADSWARPPEKRASLYRQRGQVVNTNRRGSVSSPFKRAVTVRRGGGFDPSEVSRFPSLHAI